MKQIILAVVCLLFCSVVHYAHGDTSYALQTAFYTPDCSGKPIMYSYFILNYCTVADDGKWQKIVPTSPSQSTVSFYGTPDCTGDTLSTQNYPLGSCQFDYNNNYYAYINSTAATSLDPPEKASFYTIDNYDYCNETLPVQRYIITPRYCGQNDNGTYVQHASCDGSTYTEWSFPDGNCTGSPIQKITYSLPPADGCFVNASHVGGARAKCWGSSSSASAATTTTSSASGSITTTTAKVTTGKQTTSITGLKITTSTSSTGSSSTTGGSSNFYYYAQQSFYYNYNCTGEPYLNAYVILGFCTPSYEEDVVTYQYITATSTSAATVSTYSNANCSGKAISTQTQALGLCQPDSNNPGSYTYFNPIPATSPNPPKGQPTFATDFYATCDKNSPIASRYVYNPNACLYDSENEAYIKLSSCNGSSSERFYYSNANCTGTPTAHESHALIAEGCFAPNQTSSSGGNIERCLFLGDASTGAGNGTTGIKGTTSTGAASTAAAGTTGSAGSTTGLPTIFSYAAGRTYTTSDCSGAPAFYRYSIVNTCYQTNSGSQQNVKINNTAAAVSFYKSRDCSGEAQTFYQLLGKCQPESGGDGGGTQFYSIYDSLPVASIDAVVSNAYVQSKFSTACGQGPIVERIVNNPNFCFSNTDGNQTSSFKYSCNSTFISTNYFSGSACAGNSTSQSYPTGCGESSVIHSCSAGIASSTAAAGTTAKASTTAGSGTVAGGGSATSAAPTAPPKVEATITLTIPATIENISKVDVNDLKSSFAASLGVDPAAVTITFVLVNDTRRATQKYQMVVTVKTVVDAGTDPNTITVQAATTVTASLNDQSSPLSNSINNAGATVTAAPQVSAQVSSTVVTTTTASATTTTAAASGSTATSSPAQGSSTTNKESSGARTTVSILSIVLVAILFW